MYRVRPHLRIDWDIRFWFLIVLAVVYFLSGYLCKTLKRPKLIVSNAGVAFTLIAMAVVVKFPRLSVGFFWILEAVILFAIGIYYKEFVYRMLAGILSVLLMVRLFIVDYFSAKHYLVFGMEIKHNIAIFIFAAICFYLLGAIARNKRTREYLVEGERACFSLLIAFGTLLFTFLFLRETPEKLLSLTWALQGVAILTAGFLLKDKVYRISALCVFSLACLRIAFVDMAGMNTIYKIVTFILLGAILLTASMVYSKFITKRQE